MSDSDSDFSSTSSSSLSAKDIILEYVCPLLGIIIGNCMFSAPFQDLRKAVQRGYLGDLNPTPWGFMLGNCCGWVTYSILRQNLWIFFGNCPGLCLSIWLNLGAAKLQYQSYRSLELKKQIVSYLKTNTMEGATTTTTTTKDNDDHSHSDTQKKMDELTIHDGKNKKDEEMQALQTQKDDYEKIANNLISQNSNAPAPHEQIVMFMVFLWVGLISLISFSDFSQSTNELIVGLVVNLNLVFFYGAPLSTIWEVLRTQNSASIHILTMITNTANGTFWGAYGLAILDPFVYVPNGLGAALGVIQVFLVMTIPRRQSDKEEVVVVATSEEIEKDGNDEAIEETIKTATT